MISKANYGLLRRITGNRAFGGRLISTLEKIRDLEIGILATNCPKHLTDSQILSIYSRGVSNMPMVGPFGFAVIGYYYSSGLGVKAHTTIERYFEKRGISYRKKFFRRVRNEQ